MNYFLAKTDPETYSIEDLERDKQTNWDGVRSYQAVNTIKTWKPGDKIFIYHSQGNAAIVGLAKVIGLPQKDLNDTISWYAKIKFLKKLPPEKYITLKQVKESGLFNDFVLVKQGRLSTMDCPDDFVKWMKESLNKKA